jgi:uncharacterized DUF497 family protein
METVNWKASNGVEFEWDPAKAHTNLRKHKVPFLIACEAFKDSSAIERPDTSSDYDEERWIVLGRVNHTILSVVLTYREQRIRLIPARRANGNEQRTYWTGDLSA